MSSNHNREVLERFFPKNTPTTPTQARYLLNNCERSEGKIPDLPIEVTLALQSLIIEGMSKKNKPKKRDVTKGQAKRLKGTGSRKG